MSAGDEGILHLDDCDNGRAGLEMERINEVGLAKPTATGVLKLPPLPMHGAG